MQENKSNETEKTFKSTSGRTFGVITKNESI